MSRSGKHFTDEQWVDFVRALADSAQTSAMQQHLESRCPGCAETVRLLSLAAHLEAHEATSPEVPAGLTMAARALFESPDTETETDWMEKLASLIPRLTFGRGLEWQSAGVRGIAPDESRSVFRAGDYSIDLSLEESESADRRELVGQITHETDPGQKLDGVIVRVMAQGKPLSETSTNRFGEFMLEVPAQKGTILRLALKQQGHRIDLPLKTK